MGNRGLGEAVGICELSGTVGAVVGHPGAVGNMGAVRVYRSWCLLSGMSISPSTYSDFAIYSCWLCYLLFPIYSRIIVILIRYVLSTLQKLLSTPKFRDIPDFHPGLTAGPSLASDHYNWCNTLVDNTARLPYCPTPQKLEHQNWSLVRDTAILKSPTFYLKPMHISITTRS